MNKSLIGVLSLLLVLSYTANVWACSGMGGGTAGKQTTEETAKK